MKRVNMIIKCVILCLIGVALSSGVPNENIEIDNIEQIDMGNRVNAPVANAHYSIDQVAPIRRSPPSGPRRSGPPPRQSEGRPLPPPRQSEGKPRPSEGRPHPSDRRPPPPPRQSDMQPHPSDRRPPPPPRQSDMQPRPSDRRHPPPPRQSDMQPHQFMDYNQVRGSHNDHHEMHSSPMFFCNSLILSLLISFCFIMGIVIAVKMVNRCMRWRRRRFFDQQLNLYTHHRDQIPQPQFPYFPPAQVSHLPSCPCKCDARNAPVQNHTNSNTNNTSDSQQIHINPSNYNYIPTLNTRFNPAPKFPNVSSTTHMDFSR